jgi:hypothetical protein
MAVQFTASDISAGDSIRAAANPAPTYPLRVTIPFKKGSNPANFQCLCYIGSVDNDDNIQVLIGSDGTMRVGHKCNGVDTTADTANTFDTSGVNVVTVILDQGGAGGNTRARIKLNGGSAVGVETATAPRPSEFDIFSFGAFESSFNFFHATAQVEQPFLSLDNDDFADHDTVWNSGTPLDPATLSLGEDHRWPFNNTSGNVGASDTEIDDATGSTDLTTLRGTPTYVANFLTPASSDTEITRHGITWTLSGSVTNGTFANGDPWVIGPVTVTAITRPNSTSGRDGSMVNPDPAEAHGYDDRVGSYSALLDAAEDLPALELSAGDSLVSTISFEIGDSGYLNPTSGTEFDQCTVTGGAPTVITRAAGWSGVVAGQLVVWGAKWGEIGEIREVASVSGDDLTVSGGNMTAGAGLLSYVGGALRPYLKVAAVLTVLGSAPAAGTFRPTYAAATKTLHNTSDITWANLPDLTGTASDDPADLGDFEELLARVWLDHGVNFGFAEGLRPHDNFNGTGLAGAYTDRWYAQYSTQDYNDAVQALCLSDFDQATKTDLMIRAIQVGIDLYGCIEAGGEYPGNGGQGSGRLWPILFAGKMLEDADLLAVRTDFSSAQFGEVDQTFYVTQTDVDTEHAPQRTSFTPSADADYESGDIGTAEWGIRHVENRVLDDKSWTATYRFQTGICWSGAALIAAEMDLRDEWAHEPFFDYVIRYIGHPDTDSNNARAGSTFSESMWDAYAGDAGLAPTYAVTGNPTTVLVDVESAQMTLNVTGAQITETDSVTITATNPVGGATLTDVTVRVYVDDIEVAEGTEGGITYQPAEPLSAYQFTIQSASVQTVRVVLTSSADWTDADPFDIEIVEPGEGTGAALISAFGYGFGF